MTYEELGKKLVEASKISGESKPRSGAVSDTYFDKYRFESDPELLLAIAEQMAELVPDGTDRLIGTIRTLVSSERTT